MDTPDRPYSSIYAEHYWSGGPAEKTHVYLHGNNLPARFAHAGAYGFTVSELGFGTGLNALLTLHLHSQIATGHLTYISYEQHPIPLAQLIPIHVAFPPELHPHAQALQAVYSTLHAGWNTLHLPNTTLHLYAGDAREGIATHPQPADCWFLDGFSTANNPQLWEENLLR
ncbi:MAG: tRNA 5-methylaminomethyl-2-thiouridine synthase, partial [Alphaproteobacteria bacterium]